MNKQEFKELIWAYGNACDEHAQFDELAKAKGDEYAYKLNQDAEKDELMVIESEIEEYQGKADKASARKKELIAEIEEKVDNLFKLAVL